MIKEINKDWKNNPAVFQISSLKRFNILQGQEGHLFLRWYSDYDPAWIGKASFSTTGRTIYFNEHAFQRGGIKGNYPEGRADIYWISGVKMDGLDRH